VGPPLEVESVPVPTIPEKAEILERYQSAADLVGVIARQVKRTIGPAVGVAELESCGNEGLLDAARRFDPSKRVPFRSYAYIRIRGAILDGVRAIMPLPRRTWEKLRGVEAMNRVSESFIEDQTGEDRSGTMDPADAGSADATLAEHLAALATAMAIGMLSQPVVGEFGESIPSDEQDDPEQATLRSELAQKLSRAISELPREEATIVRQHYLEGQRFDQVAEQLRVSKSWASRLHRRAIERLAKRLAES
jgi:RNA polymerase sigma factor FliA